MEDTIEVCGGCGKMPRDTELLGDRFSCTRCGHDKRVILNADEYDQTIAELDRQFTEMIFRKRVESILDNEVIIKDVKKRETAVKGRRIKTNN